ncbi:hypothetical protein CRE_25187 [Caenorhabditis remanei]|uniref:Uncharacterized protein n=1 Tax=Caenorhabditis remanei TaxID=31234 RepID=E3LRS9_CAERE|nr:hypothetical protein CRE_25187 [Caenorhabditis remanei]
MYRYNRKAQPNVTNKPKANGGSNSSKTSSASSGPPSSASSASSSHQKRQQPKSDSDSKSEKSLKNPPPRKRVQPTLIHAPKTRSPDRDKRKTVQNVGRGVANRMPFTPNKKQQHSTSTPPTSEMWKKSELRSDRIDSEFEKSAIKSKSKGRLSNSESGSNESVHSNLKKPNQQKVAPARIIKSDRSLIGLDGETEQPDHPRTGKSRSAQRRQSYDSPSSRRDKSMEDSVSEMNSVNFLEIHQLNNALCSICLLTTRRIVFTVCSEFESVKKNRTSDIPCLDSSRVRLTFMANKTIPSTDYIHANYIRSPFLKRGYILTQGPKKETIADFWRMVWQERSNAIVMLCQFVETNREKCVEYFPRNANCSLRFDKLIVTFEEAIVNKSVVSTRLNLSYEGESRLITHLQWKEWPDYQVPGSSEVMLKILRKIRARTTTPIIHCAAGVGRSGTLVAIEIALQCINTHFKLPDIKQIVTDLRLYGRATSVQTLQQYMLIWKVLLDFGVSNKLISEELTTTFASTYRQSLCKVNMS